MSNLNDPSNSAERRVTTTRLMKWVRRAHMFTGLFMAPWIFVYGISGFTFNHSRWFSDSFGKIVEPIEAKILAATAVRQAPQPDDVAGKALAAINARQAPGEQWVASAIPARYTQNLFATGTGEDGTNYQVNVDLQQGTGHYIVMKSASEPGPEKPLPDKGAEAGKSGGGIKMPAGTKLADGDLISKQELARLMSGERTRADDSQRYTEAVPAAFDAAYLSALGSEVFSVLPLKVAPASIKVTAPTLEFFARKGEHEFLVRCDLRTGEVVASPSNRPPFSLVRFLADLHVSSGYSGNRGARLAWALIVDCTSLLMCFWALSGIAMWLQMKNLRSWGWVVVVLALSVALLLGMGMHQYLMAHPKH